MENQPQGIFNLIQTIAGASVPAVLLFAVALTVLRLALLQVPDRFSRWFADLFDSLIWAALVVFLLLRPFVIQTFNIPSPSMETTLLVGDYVLVNKAIYRYTDPKVGDIVVFRGPRAALLSSQVPEKTYLIKRLVAGPGDVVEVRLNEQGKSILYRNGQVINEPFAVSSASDVQYLFNFKVVDGRSVRYNEDGVWVSPPPDQVNTIPDFAETVPVTDPEQEAYFRNAAAEPVPPGKYLVMGDNRPKSFDSRFWGLVDRDRMMGRAEFIWLPLQRIGRTR